MFNVRSSQAIDCNNATPWQHFIADKVLETHESREKMISH